MNLLQVFYQIVTPVIGIALVGYLFAEKYSIDTRSLNRTTYYFFVPAFVFNIFIGGEGINEKIIDVLPAVFIVQIAITLAAVLISKLLKNSEEMTAAYVVCSAFPNIGNFAIPLLIFRFGNKVLVDAALLFLIVLMHAFAISVFFAKRSAGIGQRLLMVLKTPAIISFFVALLILNLNIRVPLPLERITKLMGDGMIPVMLFTIGAQISAIKTLSFDRNIFVITILKLLIAPLIAFALLPLFGLDKDMHNIALIDFAMPTALLANIIATEHGIAKDTVTMVVFYTTLGSIFTLTILLAMV